MTSDGFTEPQPHAITGARQGFTAMHDIKAIRERPDLFIKGLELRNVASEEAQALANHALALDTDLRNVQTELQKKQARRNEASKEIGKAKAQKDDNRANELMLEVSSIKDAIQTGEERERELKKALEDHLAAIPNLPADDVPFGKDEHDNVEVKARAFGKPRHFAQNKPKEHFELGEALGMMDFERAAKVSGARFVYLTKSLARMERALANFMLDIHTDKFGYTEVAPPLMVLDSSAFGTGQLPKFVSELFAARSVDWEAVMQAATTRAPNAYQRGQRALSKHLKDNNIDVREMEFDELLRLGQEFQKKSASEIGTTLRQEVIEGLYDYQYWLIPTAEVPLTNYVREDILDEAALPMRFTAWTPCFRAEAGAAGKDTRGMIRMHQFSKVELVSIATPEQSDAEHERMTDCAQEILKRLDLHHRVVTLCTGDMGFAAKKTYDIEVWLPGQNRFREISSCSNCGEFQARRMNARYRPKDSKNTRFVHTLNGSGLAVGRTLIAILENYQNPDGSITIPDVLRSYMGGAERIEK